MKGFSKGANFSTSANSGFSAPAEKRCFAGGGIVGKIKAAGAAKKPGLLGSIKTAQTQGPAKKPGLLGSIKTAHAHAQGPAKKPGMLGAVKGALQGAMQKRQAPAAAPAPGSPQPKAASPSLPIKMSRPGVKRAFATGGKVEAGAGSGVFRSQVQEHGYAKGGEVKMQTIAERQVAKHVAAPAPKGHKGLKA